MQESNHSFLGLLLTGAKIMLPAPVLRLEVKGTQLR